MSKLSSNEVATIASETMRSNKSSNAVKSVAASVVSQANSPEKMTSPKKAKTAARILQDGRTSEKSKIIAGSALSQREKRG